MIAIECKPPKPFQEKKDGFKTVFLAGSIEQGKADDWQAEIVEKLSEEKIIFYNPRREEWDASWKQEIENKQFRTQVEWELDALEASDMIVMYLDPETKSPISLLELGLFARTNKLVVCCPHGFFRKGNVDIVCKQFNIPMVDTIKQLIDKIKD